MSSLMDKFIAFPENEFLRSIWVKLKPGVGVANKEHRCHAEHIFVEWKSDCWGGIVHWNSFNIDASTRELLEWGMMMSSFTFFNQIDTQSSTFISYRSPMSLWLNSGRNFVCSMLDENQMDVLCRNRSFVLGVNTIM